MQAGRLEHVDDAAVGQPGDGQVRHLGERRAVVQRAGEDRAGFGEQGQPLRAAAALGVEGRAPDGLRALAGDGGHELDLRRAERDVPVEAQRDAPDLAQRQADEHGRACGAGQAGVAPDELVRAVDDHRLLPAHGLRQRIFVGVREDSPVVLDPGRVAERGDDPEDARALVQRRDHRLVGLEHVQARVQRGLDRLLLGARGRQCGRQRLQVLQALPQPLDAHPGWVSRRTQPQQSMGFRHGPRGARRRDGRGKRDRPGELRGGRAGGVPPARSRASRGPCGRGVAGARRYPGQRAAARHGEPTPPVWRGPPGRSSCVATRAPASPRRRTPGRAPRRGDGRPASSAG